MEAHIDYDSIKKADEINGKVTAPCVLNPNPFDITPIETVREPANLPPASPELQKAAALALKVYQAPPWYRNR